MYSNSDKIHLFCNRFVIDNCEDLDFVLLLPKDNIFEIELLLSIAKYITIITIYKIIYRERNNLVRLPNFTRTPPSPK